MRNEFESQAKNCRAFKIPSLIITRSKLTSSIVQVIKMTDGNDDADIDYDDDPFSQRMREIGIDLKMLEDGTAIEFDSHR